MNSNWNRQLLELMRVEEQSDYTFNETALHFIRNNYPSDHPKDIVHLIRDYVSDKDGNLTGISIDQLGDKVQYLNTLTELEGIIINSEQLDLYSDVLEQLSELRVILINDDPAFDHMMDATYNLYDSPYDPQYYENRLQYIGEYRPGVKMYRSE